MNDEVKALNFEEEFGVKLGSHGKVTRYFEGRHVEIDIMTDNKTEKMIRLIVGTPSMPGFGSAVVASVKLVEMSTGREVNFTNMYISSDHADPLAGTPVGWGGERREARVNSNLLTNSHYRLIMDVPEDVGHESWEPQFRLTHAATDNADDEIINNNTASDIRHLVIDGVSGHWTADAG